MRSNRSSTPPTGPVLPLDMMRCGEGGHIAGVRGGRGITRRLASMGLARGVEVRVVSNMGSFGPIMVRVASTKIGIGRGMARRVLVRPNDTGHQG